MSNCTLTALIVDDEPLARQLMRMQLAKCEINVKVTEAASAMLAKQWLEKNECDVIFLDIHMPDINGLEFAKTQQKTANKQSPALIFVTADSTHALKAFDLAALDYLTKPVTLERLEKTLQRIYNLNTRAALEIESANQDRPFITIESHQHITRIPLDEVLYFHADNKYTHIITKSQSYFSEDSLNSLEERFTSFVTRVHRSYLVVNKAIDKLVKNTPLESEQENWCVKLHHVEILIPISRRQQPIVRKLLQDKP